MFSSIFFLKIATFIETVNFILLIDSLNAILQVSLNSIHKADYCLMFTNFKLPILNLPNGLQNIWACTVLLKLVSHKFCVSGLRYKVTISSTCEKIVECMACFLCFKSEHQVSERNCSTCLKVLKQLLLKEARRTYGVLLPM